MTVDIRPGGLGTESVGALIDAHLAYSEANSPPTSIFSLGPDALTKVTAFWAGWDGETAVGMIALNMLDDRRGEVKSMHVLPQHRGTGLADRLVDTLVADARARGVTHLMLETGAKDAYAPARAFYARHGFTLRGPFGPYADDPWSAFMERALT